MMKVEEKLDRNKKPWLEVSTDKMNNKVHIKKSEDGYFFYEISYTKGVVPTNLQGRFMTLEDALKATTKHIEGMKKSASKRRDETYEENHKVAPSSKSVDT